MVIALVGVLSRAEAEAIAAKVSASLPKGPALVSGLYRQLPANGSELVIFDLNRERDFEGLLDPGRQRRGRNARIGSRWQSLPRVVPVGAGRFG